LRNNKRGDQGSDDEKLFIALALPPRLRIDDRGA
jgi:hypothetical protein